MMLCKLSLKNIKKSFKDYTIYFFTLILGVAIFYVFNAIDSQTVLLQTKKSTYDIIEMMTQTLSAVSVFVSFILGFLIIYASRFLIKRRNKEFAIYMTLGMGKRKISMILFIETIIIGLLSLGVGLGLGVILSQLMSLLVANMFEADMTNFAFTFSKGALIKTIIYFGIMYLLVMIFNTIQISRCKLIDLINANKRSEKVKIKNPVICTIIFLIAVTILGYCYYRVSVPDGANALTVQDMGIIIALGATSTFLLFWSLSGLMLKVVQSMKNVYYKGLNSFTLRQISSKINTTVFSMTIICLMLFVTICVLSSSLSIKNSMTANLKELAPADIELMKKRNIPKELQEDYGYTDGQIESSYKTISETLKELNIDEDKYLKDQTTLHLYTDESITYATTMGKELESMKKMYPYLDYTSPEIIVKLSEYNKVAKMYNNKTYSLDDDEYMIIGDYESMTELRDKALKIGTSLTIFGKELTPKYKEVKDGFIQMSSNHITDGIIIVPDEVINVSSTSPRLEEEYMVANYKANDEKTKQEIEEVFINPELNDLYPDVTLNGTTRIAIYDASVGLGAMITFIGLYLGIIFLISSAALLALKELSESADNITRYTMLRRIGATDKQLNKALFRQIAIFFIFPLIIAIIHSIFGIKFCTFILETFGKEEMLASVSMTMLFLILIYGGYFLITYYCSKNIIKEKRI